MENALTEFIRTMVGGLGEMATGIGTGLNSAVTEMFLTTDASTHAVTGLSTFGGVVRTSSGRRTDLAVGLTSLVFNWVSNIGK